MTSQEPENPPTADSDTPATEVIAVSTPAPVFVDSTGRRSRLLRRVALAFGVLVLAYGGLLSVSLAGGPVTSSAVFPLPGLDDDRDDEPAPRPKPSPTPQPTLTSSAPLPRYIPESLQRRTESAERRRGSAASTRPTRSPSSKPVSRTPTPTPSTSRSTESTTKPGASGPSPAPSIGTSNPPGVEVPPNPPGTGGTAGGGENTGGEGAGGGVSSEPKPAATVRPTGTNSPPPALPEPEDDSAESATPSRAAP